MLWRESCNVSEVSKVTRPAEPDVWKPSSLFGSYAYGTVVCGACIVVNVGYYLARTESCSVLSGSVVAMGHVSVLKSFKMERVVVTVKQVTHFSQKTGK
jgi:hypothetical protein